MLRQPRWVMAQDLHAIEAARALAAHKVLPIFTHRPVGAPTSSPNGGLALVAGMPLPRRSAGVPHTPHA